MKLREYKPEDASVICKWIRSEDELYKWSADRFNKFPLPDYIMNINYSEQVAGGRFFPLTATDDEGKVVGHFIIRYPKADDNSSVRFGFVIVDPDVRGKGYGREMILQGIKYAKEKLNASRADLGVFENNDSARRCYESVGFKEFGQRACEMPIGTWNCINMEMSL